MSARLKDLFLSMDMFGSPIQFNFRQKGTVYNTVVGGVFSGFINLFILIVVVTNIKEMFTGENANYFSNETAPDMKEIGNIKLKDSGVKIMYALLNTERNESYKNMTIEEL